MTMTRNEAIDIANEYAAARHPELAQIIKSGEWTPQDWIIDAIMGADRSDGFEAINMPICEASKVLLKFGRLYRFYPVDGCAACEKYAKNHDAAYGVTTPQPTSAQLDLPL